MIPVENTTRNITKMPGFLDYFNAASDAATLAALARSDPAAAAGIMKRKQVITIAGLVFAAAVVALVAVAVSKAPCPPCDNQQK
jgi:hypothetical protein